MNPLELSKEPGPTLKPESFWVRETCSNLDWLVALCYYVAHTAISTSMLSKSDKMTQSGDLGCMELLNASKAVGSEFIRSWMLWPPEIVHYMRLNNTKLYGDLSHSFICLIGSFELNPLHIPSIQWQWSFLKTLLTPAVSNGFTWSSFEDWNTANWTFPSGSLPKLHLHPRDSALARLRVRDDPVKQLQIYAIDSWAIRKSEVVALKGNQHVFAATCTKIRYGHMPLALRIDFSKKNMKDHEIRKCTCSLLQMEAEQLFLQPALIKCGSIVQVYIHLLLPPSTSCLLRR